MADAKFSNLCLDSGVAGTDLLALVDDPTGSPLSRKITIANSRTISNYDVLLDTGASATAGASNPNKPADQDTGDGWRMRVVEWQATYPVLEFVGWAQFAVDSAAFWFDTSIDSGATWTAAENGHETCRYGYSSAAAVVSAEADADDLVNLHNEIGNAANEYACFRLFLHNYGSEPTSALLNYNLVIKNDLGVAEVVIGAAKLDTGADITDIALYGAANQNVDTGRLTVYGHRGYA